MYCSTSIVRRARRQSSAIAAHASPGVRNSRQEVALPGAGRLGDLDHGSPPVAWEPS
jgi:hypothetical protein